MLLKLEFFLYTTFLVLGTLIPIIVAVAFFTLSERKIMAFIQRREGPNATGTFGLLQPLADGLKLLIAEPIRVMQATPYLYMLSATLPLVFSLMQWSVIPLGYYEAVSNNSFINILYLFPLSLGGVYGVMLSGWASNSKYSSIGSFRSIAQLVSYDIPFILSILPLLIVCGSLNITEIAYLQSKTLWFFFLNVPAALVFFITALAETNRAPFDLPEAEAELVAGFNVEYSAMFFALFFLGEYSSMLLTSLLCTQLFFSEDTVLSLFLCIFLAVVGVFIVVSIDDLLNISKDFLSKYEEYMLIVLCMMLVDTIIPVYHSLAVLMYSVPPFPTRCIFWMGIYFINNFLTDTAYFLICSYISTIFVLKIPYSIKTIIVCVAFIVARAVAPRYRYDQLMNFCWKGLIPLSLSNVFMSLSLLLLFNGFVGSV